jgi:hypothetical protein
MWLRCAARGEAAAVRRRRRRAEGQDKGRTAGQRAEGQRMEDLYRRWDNTQSRASRFIWTPAGEERQRRHSAGAKLVRLVGWCSVLAVRGSGLVRRGGFGAQVAAKRSERVVRLVGWRVVGCCS